MVRLIAFCLVTTTIALPARAADAVPGLAVERAVVGMKTGDHRWEEDGDPAAPVSVVISVPMQMAFVYRGNVLVGASTVSTGKPGKTTPTGEYTILQKKVFHRSNLYANAPMPYMQRLTWDGIAIHAGALPGFPASHGCIRIPTAFAKRLFDATALGGTVAVVNDVVQYPAVRPAIDPPELQPDVAALGGPGFDAVTIGRGTQRARPRFAPSQPVVQPTARRR